MISLNQLFDWIKFQTTDLYRKVRYSKEKYVYLKEMATVGRLDNDNIVLTIFPEPLGNPSFHIRYKKEYEAVVAIRDFSILEWKHKKKRSLKQIPRKHRNIITEFLTSKHPDLNDSNWKFLLLTWNVNNPKYHVNAKMKIPDWLKGEM